ncbi:hypothetical protein [Zooshikella harenae]|uniref:Type II secretion system protein GspF domain-containing protein n=1 Tax=Zooshikella harenae TaxID=2827238 RepID=A0ABS5ZHI0_9GAMM|nr:hypothetical protein [Zooshikella harenae]MBU2713527.1 hypothetical protein [Zooshikella harenae]
MAWKRFGYICRKASVDYKEQEKISTCLSRIESEKSCDLYGSKIRIDSWPRKILDEIGNIQDKQKALDIIEIYKGLNLVNQFELPMRFKRVIGYLGFVTFFFCILVGIYQLKVAPSFLEVFENFKISIPSHLLFYQEYWKHVVLVISVMLVFSFVIAFKMKKLFVFTVGIENSFIVKFLMFRSVRESYQRIIEILRFPILFFSGAKKESDDQIVSHLQSINKSKMCISKEMQELIEIEMQSILENCERQMKLMSTVVALVVVVAIFFFLVSAYSPLSILGDIL